jgi:hypothetical protein
MATLGNCGIIREMTDYAIDGRLNTLCITDDTIWKGLTTAPTSGIAVFGQLMISTSSSRELEIGDYNGIIRILCSAFCYILSRLTSANNAVSEAKTNLQRIEQEAKRVEEEKEEIYDDFIKRLQNMHVDVKKEIGRNEIIKLLGDGLSHLSKLNSNWAGLTKNFKSINNHIEQISLHTEH